MSNIISVVMTSYNGELYIVKQLQSIMKQTRMPDEVIISDDGSNDNTVELIKNFIAQNKLLNWQIIQNEKNLGWMKNFYEAIKRSKGEIIFFCDQDDEWHPNKIELMSTCMIEHHAGCVYGECNVINEKSEITTDRMLHTRWSGKIKQVPFDKRFNTIVTLGCRMCISRQVADIYLSLNEPNSGHDTQCGRLALLFSTMWYIDSPVINYRIHDNNTSGIASNGSFGKSNIKKRIDSIRQNLLWLEKLKNLEQATPDKIELLNRIIEMQQDRLKYLTKMSGSNIFSLRKYKQYYSGRSMWIGDFSYRHGINNFMGNIKWKLVKATQK